MMRAKKLYVALIVFTSTICALIVMASACSFNFTNPSHDLKNLDLEGEWVTHYSGGTTDTLTINSNGTFRQVFENSRQDYVFNSGWNMWTLERLENGVFRLHLQGARFYNEGNSLAERNGRKNPGSPCLDTDCEWGFQPDPFYDPFTDELIEMVDKRVLVVLLDSRENLILHHVWSSSDRGFLLFNKDHEFL